VGQRSGEKESKLIPGNNLMLALTCIGNNLCREATCVMKQPDVGRQRPGKWGVNDCVDSGRTGATSEKDKVSESSV